ncbi:MAG: hypothetical protein HFG17_04095 [Oscillospiraceae bacterium]|nr:hypothetical protein [Oscillospiraceae bacterium]
MIKYNKESAVLRQMAGTLLSLTEGVPVRAVSGIRAAPDFPWPAKGHLGRLICGRKEETK